MTLPAPLAPGECPILQRYPEKLAPVLAEYNRAVQAAKKLAEKFPAVFEQPEVAESVEALRRARGELVTPRFKVGFLGPFQCGKSSMLNNVLGTEISGTGAGKATTSVITRLVVDPAAEPPKLLLRFFDTESYARRRNTLCGWLRLPNAEGRSESQLLDALKNHNPSRAGGSNARPVLDEDKHYLNALLQSCEDNRGLVRAVAHEETAKFADKDKLLTHNHDEQGRTKSSQYLLLNESELHFATKAIDPEIELVDCPGLGSSRSVDDLLTKEYIPQLNGALVFLNAGAMFSAQVIEILNDLKAHFGSRLPARVWVVVNRMDSPDRKAKLIGDTNGNTTFDLIAELEKLHGIPLGQVLLGCKTIYELAGEGGVADRQRALDKLDFVRPGDEELLKKKLEPYPALAAAVEDLIRDGSVSRLRTLIRERIGPSVAGEILEEAGRIARSACADLEYALKQAEQPASEEERFAAQVWVHALTELQVELGVTDDGERGAVFNRLVDLGKAARTLLAAEFDKFCSAAATDAMTREQLLQEQFAFDAERMQRETIKEFEKIVHNAFGEVSGKLAARNLPGVALPGGVGATDAWDAFQKDDRAGGDWRDQILPRLADAELQRRLADGSVHLDFNGERYRRLWHDKIRVASQQLALAARGRLRFRLDDLRKQVSRKLVAQPRTSGSNQ